MPGATLEIPRLKILALWQSSERKQKMQNNIDIDHLILNGVLEPVGLDQETGEMLYNFTSKLEKIYPELHREAMNMVNQKVMRLWEQGFVEIDLTSENPLVKLTLKSFDDAEVSRLDSDDQYSLKEIKRICSN